jgi:hypothetical protein
MLIVIFNNKNIAPHKSKFKKNNNNNNKTES